MQGSDLDVHPEVAAWWAVREIVASSPRLWIPAEAEHGLYRDNALSPTLRAAFDDLLVDDPDDDDVEERVDEVAPWVRSFAWDDGSIDDLYDGLSSIEGPWVVRRLGSTTGRTATTPRGVLLALRDTWNDAWRLDAVLDRIRVHRSVDVIAAPVVVHAIDRLCDDAVASAVGARVPEAAGWQVWCDDRGACTRIVVPRVT